MRVFITGASGYIGNVVAQAFRSKGHTVYGLVRSQEDANRLNIKEIWPIIGDLEKPDSYRHLLNDVEVAVHCAFDWLDKGVERDALTIETILDAFSKSSLPRSFIYTSGVWLYGSRGYQLVDESTLLNPIPLISWRPGHEEKVLKATNPNLRTVILRPGCVYGNVGGLTKLLFESTQNGSVTIIGEGQNRWPMIHVQDLAYAYVAAAEKELTHMILNVVDDSSMTIREMAEAIAKAANMEGKIHSLSTEEAEKCFGPLAQGLALDLQANNSRIKRLLGWRIHHAPFINEVYLYYNAWKTSLSIEEEF